MSKPHFYYVRPGDETPDEPSFGLYWADDEGIPHGPYSSREDAEIAAGAWAPDDREDA